MTELCEYVAIPQISFVTDMATNNYLNEGVLLIQAIYIDKDSYGWEKRCITLEVDHFAALSRESFTKELLLRNTDWTQHSLNEFLRGFDDIDEKQMNKKRKKKITITHQPNDDTKEEIHIQMNDDNEIEEPEATQLQSQQTQLTQSQETQLTQILDPRDIDDIQEQEGIKTVFVFLFFWWFGSFWLDI